MTDWETQRNPFEVRFNCSKGDQGFYLASHIGAQCVARSMRDTGLYLSMRVSDVRLIDRRTEEELLF